MHAQQLCEFCAFKFLFNLINVACLSPQDFEEWSRNLFWISWCNFHKKWPTNFDVIIRQGFEHDADPVFQNLGTDLGFLKALALMMRLHPLGLWYGGVPCCSFGFLSSPTHGRGALTPWGNPWPFVYAGNVLCTRYITLALLALIRGCVWMLEQPEKTTISHIPPVQLLMRDYLRPLMAKWFCPQLLYGCTDMNMIYVTCTQHPTYIKIHYLSTIWPRWMGLYGHWCIKPQVALGNAPLELKVESAYKKYDIDFLNIIEKISTWNSKCLHFAPCTQLIFPTSFQSSSWCWGHGWWKSSASWQRPRSRRFMNGRSTRKRKWFEKLFPKMGNELCSLAGLTFRWYLPQ